MFTVLLHLLNCYACNTVKLNTFVKLLNLTRLLWYYAVATFDTHFLCLQHCNTKYDISAIKEQ